MSIFRSNLHGLAYIVRPGADQLSCGYLLQRMRHPAHRARQGEQHQRRIMWQGKRIGQGRQRKIYVWAALGGHADDCNRVILTTEGALPSVYPVTDLASASMAAVALSIAKLRAQASGNPVEGVHVDRRLASVWFATSLRPIGWQVPSAWDPIAGDYKTRDGWIRLHTNAPHHRLAAERILGAHSDKAGMAKAVALWDKAELETAIVEAGGCAAEMRSSLEWSHHPQGRAVAQEPLIHLDRKPLADMPVHPVDSARPLAGQAVFGTDCELLLDYRSDVSAPAFALQTDADLSDTLELTSWGEAKRIRWSIQINGCPACWAIPARELGCDAACWPA